MANNHYLDSRKLSNEEVVEAERIWKIDGINAVYNNLIAEEGLADFTFDTRFQIPGREHQYGKLTRCYLSSMRLNFNGKLSCRGYNRFCSLWGEAKPNAVEEAGHRICEDAEVAKIAFEYASSNSYSGSDSNHNLNRLHPHPFNRSRMQTIKVRHWDRHSSVWNVRYGMRTGVYSNQDAHSNSIKKLAEFKRIKLTAQQIKELRPISKILTFRVLFGEGNLSALNHFNRKLKEGDKDCTFALEMARKYGFANTSEELIDGYYRAMEELGYIDEYFKLDSTKDVTVFFTETAVYVFAAKWLWDNFKVRSILKYDSFFLDLGDLEDITDSQLEDLMKLAIEAGMAMYKEWDLPVGHDFINASSALTDMYVNHVVKAMDNGVDITLQSIKEDLAGWDEVSASEVATRVGIKNDKSNKLSGLYGKLGVAKSLLKCNENDEAARNYYLSEIEQLQKAIAEESLHAPNQAARAVSVLAKAIEHMKEIKAKLDAKIKLTNSEMAAKSQFKKKHPAEFEQIFGGRA